VIASFGDAATEDIRVNDQYRIVFGFDRVKPRTS
jgi:plasmid maintenance system killer protein